MINNKFNTIKENMEATFNCSLELVQNEIIVKLRDVEYGIDISQYPKCYYSNITNWLEMNHLERKSITLSINYFKFLVKKIEKNY